MKLGFLLGYSGKHIHIPIDLIHRLVQIVVLVGWQWLHVWNPQPGQHQRHQRDATSDEAGERLMKRWQCVNEGGCARVWSWDKGEGHAGSVLCGCGWLAGSPPESMAI